MLKMMRTVPEPSAELLSAEDVHEDVASLSALLEQRRTKRQAYEIFESSEHQGDAKAIDCAVQPKIAKLVYGI
jgi:hypothetical protein